MQHESDIFKISVDQESLTASSHDIRYDKYKILIFTEHQVILRLTVKLNGRRTEIENYYLTCLPGTNVLCICKHKKKYAWIKKFNKISLSTIPGSGLEIAPRYGISHTATSQQVQITQHELTPQPNTVCFSIDFETSKQQQTLQQHLKKLFAFNAVPTETFIKHAYGKLQSETMIKKLSLNKFQQFLLELPPQSRFCKEIYSYVGHMQPFATGTFLVPMTTPDFLQVQNSLPTNQFADLFTTPENPQVYLDPWIDEDEDIESDYLMEIFDNERYSEPGQIMNIE